MTSNSLHWSVDSMVKKGTTVFSYGWIFNESKQIAQLALLLVDDKGSLSSIKADYGKSREDVGAYFSDFEHAGNAGYIIYGSFNTSSEGIGLRLCCTYTDGTVEHVDIPDSHYLHAGNEKNDNKISKKLILKQIFVLIKRTLMLVRSGNFSLLYNKVRRYKNTTPIKGLNTAGDITSLLNSNERKKVIFFLDHDLGGGANHYRNRLIQDKISDGFSALVLAFNISSLTYKLIVKSASGESSYKIPGIEFIYDLLGYIEIKEIIYNTGVSFVNPETIPSFLLDLKLKTNAQLITLAHDLFPICPSHFLLNDKGQYCDIPDPTVCRACLKNNTYGFTTLFESGDINEWRDQWGGMIIASDKFITFSQNTLDLYKRVYHQIQPENTLISPHVVSYLPEKAVIKQKERLRIGIVGQIGHHKGADFVKELSLEIKKTNCQADIVVIGAIEASCSPEVVSQTGPYKQAELPALLEEHGVNIILFPSIWPETFSYVVQEMVELGYPVACFNLGAPAERLKNYHNGLVLSSMSAGNVLQELVKFHRKVYSI
jgi:hypothetical protein